MKEIDYWEQFVSTGSVKDFLAFKDMERRGVHRAEEKKAGEDSHAGIYRNNGDGIKG